MQFLRQIMSNVQCVCLAAGRLTTRWRHWAVAPWNAVLWCFYKTQDSVATLFKCGEIW